MQLPPGMDMAKMESKLGYVETHANAALALAIILIITQVIMAIVLFQAWQNVRAFHHQPADPERGLELQGTSRGVPTEAASHDRPQGPPLTVPAPVQLRNPVARSPAAAYDGEAVHGESDGYFNPAPISRRPTYTVDSGTGEQTHGTDYTKERRERRFEDRHNTNKNNANYGRRGNKYAHGT